MTTATYDIGDLHQSTISLYALDGVTLTDPTALTFALTKPDGTILSYIYATDAELVKDSTGVYHVDITYDQKGRHLIKWVATGAVQLAETLETYAV